MERLARAGFSWHLSPGCLQYRSVTPLSCPPFPYGAVGSEYFAHKDGALVGRTARAVLPPGNGSFCLPLPSQYIRTQRCCPFPEQNTGDLGLSREVSAKYSPHWPTVTFVRECLSCPRAKMSVHQEGENGKRQERSTVGSLWQLMALPCFCHAHLCLASGSLSVTAAPVPCFSTARISSSLFTGQGTSV